jgi:hypothetical protein
MVFFGAVTLGGFLDQQFPYYCGLEGPLDHTPEITGYKFRSFQVMFRHGARASLSDETCFGGRANYTCPLETTFGLETSDEMQAIHKLYEEPGGCMRGQLLTEHAIPQIQKVSDWVENTYGKYLDAGKLSFRSTDIQRTLASMYFFKNILFRGKSKSSVLTREYEGDALAMNRVCPKAASLEAEFAAAQEVQELRSGSKYQRCARRWKEIVKTEFSPSAFDCLMSSRCAGVVLPGGLEIPDDLFACTVELESEIRKLKHGVTPSSYQQKALEACSLNVMPVLSEIRTKLESGQSGFIASHDSTIACLLQTVGKLWDGIWPKYAETLVFENFSRDGKNFVRIVRNGKAVSELIPLHSLGELRNNECESTFTLNI